MRCTLIWGKQGLIQKRDGYIYQKRLTRKWLKNLKKKKVKKQVPPEDTKSLRIAVRQNEAGGFVFINHYQRLQKLDDLPEVVIETDFVQFPPIAVTGKVAFILPFMLRFAGQTIRTATAQLLCSQGDTLFFAAIPGIPARYEIEGAGTFDGEQDKAITVGALSIVTVSWEKARFLRKLDGEVCVGDGCDLYLSDGQVCMTGDGSFSYRKWEGGGFVSYNAERETVSVSFHAEPAEEPFTPPYESELQ